MKIEKTVDRASTQKLYVQIYTILLEKMKGGEWPVGSQIPPEDELCRIYGVSKVTVREAIQTLVREGYLKRRQGKGTFVMDSSLHQGIVVRTRLSEEDLYGKEAKVQREILTKGIRVPPEEVKKYLMTEEGVHYVCMRKVVNDEAYGEEIFIPVHILPGFQKENMAYRSFYDILEKKGTIKISKVLQTVGVTRADNEIASVLRVQKDSPLIRVCRIFTGSEGTPIAYVSIAGRARNQSVQMEFEKIS